MSCTGREALKTLFQQRLKAEAWQSGSLCGLFREGDGRKWQFRLAYLKVVFLFGRRMTLTTSPSAAVKQVPSAVRVNTSMLSLMDPACFSAIDRRPPEVSVLQTNYLEILARLSFYLHVSPTRLRLPKRLPVLLYFSYPRFQLSLHLATWPASAAHSPFPTCIFSSSRQRMSPRSSPWDYRDFVGKAGGTIRPSLGCAAGPARQSIRCMGCCVHALQRSRFGIIGLQSTSLQLIMA